MAEMLLETPDLRGYFRLAGPWGRGPWLKAVDGVDLHLAAGETLGLVGESGCGKSTLALLRLLPRLLSKVQGEIFFAGEELLSSREERLRQIRDDRIAMVFQEPMTAVFLVKNTVNLTQ